MYKIIIFIYINIYIYINGVLGRKGWAREIKDGMGVYRPCEGGQISWGGGFPGDWKSA